MATVKNYIQAARLRTLPLSVSGIIVGASLGKFYSNNDWLNSLEGSLKNLNDAGALCYSFDAFWQSPIFWLAILTTIGFQVLSNFANDYGDGIKGTDDDRVGEQRLVASGAISPKQMKKAMIITGLLTLVVALLLIYTAFGKDDFLNSVIFFFLGIASIVAAIKYTVGKKAYGYSCLGDVFVFLFFGLLSVIGTYYLFSKSITDFTIVLPAAAFGMLSAAVLNLNNMRDQIQDKKAGKITLVVQLGSQKAKYYHYALIIGALILLVSYKLIAQSDYLTEFSFIFLVAFIPLFLNIKKVAQNIIFSELDGELKKVALATFLCAILFTL